MAEETKSMRKTPKRSINLYWTARDQLLLEQVGAKLVKEGVPGVTKGDGSYNISVIMRYLLEQAAQN